MGLVMNEVWEWDCVVNEVWEWDCGEWGLGMGLVVNAVLPAVALSERLFEQLIKS